MKLIHHFHWQAGIYPSLGMCNDWTQAMKLLRSFLRGPSALYADHGTIWHDQLYMVIMAPYVLLVSWGELSWLCLLPFPPGVLTERTAEKSLAVQALFTNNGNIPVFSILFLAQIQTQPCNSCHGYSCPWNETQQTTTRSLPQTGSCCNRSIWRLKHQANFKKLGMSLFTCIFNYQVLYQQLKIIHKSNILIEPWKNVVFSFQQTLILTEFDVLSLWLRCLIQLTFKEGS